MNLRIVQPSAPQIVNRASSSCRLCGSKLTHTFVDLGMSPPCEDFRTAFQLDGPETYYPLHVLVCDECFLVQLKEYVSPDEIFTEYAYFSSYSTSWVAHCRNYCEMIARRLSLGANSLALELASNDGYLLQHFLPLGVPILGVEPAANVAKVAVEKGIPTLVDFFGVRMARQLLDQGTRPDLIIGNNVLAQVPDLNDFVAGMKLILKPEGAITLEFPHLERLIAESQFDTIYHEHFSYFSLLTIEDMARRHALKIFDVEELPTHGGSLRVYLTHEGASHPVSQAVSALIARERLIGLDRIETYGTFSQQAEQVKRNLLSFLIAARNEGKRVCGYGAPGKGNTLLNYCGIGRDLLDFTVDRNPYKHGRFTPGMHIPIHPVEALERARPDYVLILPWNLRDEIAEQLDYIGQWGGKLVVPIPHLSIADAKGRWT